MAFAGMGLQTLSSIDLLDGNRSASTCRWHVPLVTRATWKWRRAGYRFRAVKLPFRRPRCRARLHVMVFGVLCRLSYATAAGAVLDTESLVASVLHSVFIVECNSELCRRDCDHCKR
jgi:hypothetical protein